MGWNPTGILMFKETTGLGSSGGGVNFDLRDLIGGRGVCILRVLKKSPGLLEPASPLTYSQ